MNGIQSISKRKLPLNLALHRELVVEYCKLHGFFFSSSDLEKRDDDTEAYNFPSHSQSTHSHEKRHRVDSITKESLLPDSVQ